jgi:glycosyltransferase involved in cell wall biosynthesis
MPDTLPLSLIVITRDAAFDLAACIASAPFVAETVVVDSGSRDDTVAIAQAAGARVVAHPFEGYGPQKNFAVAQAAHDWVLCIDADERVSDALRDEIGTLHADGLAAVAGWSVPRMSCYLGRWIRHGTWYPDRSVRLFDRRRGRFAANPDYDLHERVVLDGPCGTLRHDLLHVPYRNLGEHLRTIDTYTTIMAQGLQRRGRRARASDLVLHPWARFFTFYVLKRGFLDGWRGLLLAYLAAHYVRLKYGKLLVLQRAGGAAE